MAISSLPTSISTIQARPENSFSCVALIKARSKLSKEWKLAKPGYCIYEYDKGFNSHEIRWGDGSSHDLTAEYFDDVVLLPQLNESTFDEIFGQ
jgi:hypothetical protein